MAPAEFKAVFPEFTSETDARIQIFIDRAAPFFDVTRWDDWYAEGIGNFVAHGIFMANKVAASPASASSASGAGAQISKKVGDVSVGYSEQIKIKAMENPYLQTAYGQQYLYLKRLVGLGALAV